tara:strand:+ start:219 stop:500 length:282 start_codon:yes stop_codon:yes gene_type:complete
MKKIMFISSLLLISLFNLTYSSADECAKMDKLTKEYAMCTSDKIKKETSEKTKEIKFKAAQKIEDSKKKLKSFNLKDKLRKFKNSKTHKEFTG